ncbi:hypothetical protein KO561_07950 [Radiobacillus kanasensis]|uniref:hypothetical protein n=1 Tax=Radiobacillus kanasensis TaxID=2844358 RepID=UPI001E6151EE|nr:hypothetical protein [Radiobacillus kanasensis]UFU00853.1 hypothetical protein KO561_07950 [Radiobacillus kanasensis]
MKRFIVFVFIFFIVLLTACSSDKEEAAVTKETIATGSTVNEEPVLEERTENSDEEKKMYLEFTIPNEQVTINLDYVPILDQYLQGLEDKQQAIQQMELMKMEVPEMQPYYLLEFSCYENRCSYMLLDQSEEGRSFLLTDMAKFKQSSISPEKTMMMLLFERQESKKEKQISTHKVMVFDLQEWKPVPIESEDYPLDYTLPIQQASWVDNERIKLSLADFTQLENPSTEGWFQSEKPVKQIEINLNN